jgi:hypothetical protein
MRNTDNLKSAIAKGTKTPKQTKSSKNTTARKNQTRKYNGNIGIRIPWNPPNPKSEGSIRGCKFRFQSHQIGNLKAGVLD